jgi:hypothetical protein
MTKWTRKTRDDVASLIKDHQSITDALANISKSTWVCELSLSHEADNDFIAVGLTVSIAKRVIAEQKAWTETKLAKYGIDID